MNAPAILEARAAWIAEGEANATNKMHHLPEEHFVQIVEWLLTPLPVAKILELAKTELQLPPGKLPGKTGLYTFWDSFSRFWLQAWRRQAARQATVVRDEVQKAPGDWETPVLDMVQQRAFEMLADPSSGAKELKGLLTLVLKHKDQKLKSQQIELQERKMTLLEQRESAAKSALGDANLTPADREKRMREIFGMA